MSRCSGEDPKNSTSGNRTALLGRDDILTLSLSMYLFSKIRHESEDLTYIVILCNTCYLSRGMNNILSKKISHK